MVVLFSLANHKKHLVAPPQSLCNKKTCFVSFLHNSSRISIISDHIWLQTAAEDELSRPHQGHFCWTGGTQIPWYVTQPLFSLLYSVFIPSIVILVVYLISKYYIVFYCNLTGSVIAVDLSRFISKVQGYICVCVCVCVYIYIYSCV